MFPDIVHRPPPAIPLALSPASTHSPPRPHVCPLLSLPPPPPRYLELIFLSAGHTQGVCSRAPRGPGLGPPSPAPLSSTASFSVKFPPDGLLTRLCSLPSRVRTPVLYKAQMKNRIACNSVAVPGEPTAATVGKRRTVPDGRPELSPGSDARPWPKSQKSQGRRRLLPLRTIMEAGAWRGASPHGGSGQARTTRG